ncbi:helix-turn-helix domain-containing protein [Crenobacter cavernae]|uniref:helix-turn-helix domain-containing protein n=1 Tax=Crenobacter cavernae TaxID=2290923 RepID=UPI001C6A8677|nr:LysR family transcriptional regulator [Crenobacter cavernae]
METGSFTAAAARLDLSKSVVSKRIGDLEAALGTQLLHRSTRGEGVADGSWPAFLSEGALLRK